MEQTRTRRLLLASILLVILGIILFAAARLTWFAFVPAAPGSKQSLIVEVHRGHHPKEISKFFKDNGIVTNEVLFHWVGRFTRQWNKLKTGEYRVSPAMSPLEIFATLTSGISVAHPLTVREGENMYEIADDLESKGLAKKDSFLALVKSSRLIKTLGLETPGPASLEGYLFPDTYFFNKTMSAEDMVRQMIRRAQAIWGPEQKKRAEGLGMTRHQILTLASIVEKETGVPQERPLISSVFHNRLRKRMRLQSDPTIIYGIWEEYDGNIHRDDITRRTPYNTYVIGGLPIGPIGNPGREAIDAALNPAQTDFLFFVSHNDGTHEFTRTFAEHTAAVRTFQINPKAREGKSWRDYYKNSHATKRLSN